MVKSCSFFGMTFFFNLHLRKKYLLFVAKQRFNVPKKSRFIAERPYLAAFTHDKNTEYQNNWAMLHYIRSGTYMRYFVSEEWAPCLFFCCLYCCKFHLHLACQHSLVEMVYVMGLGMFSLHIPSRWGISILKILRFVVASASENLVFMTPSSLMKPR